MKIIINQQKVIGIRVCKVILLTNEIWYIPNLLPSTWPKSLATSSGKIVLCEQTEQNSLQIWLQQGLVFLWLTLYIVKLNFSLIIKLPNTCNQSSMHTVTQQFVVLQHWWESETATSSSAVFVSKGRKVISLFKNVLLVFEVIQNNSIFCSLSNTDAKFFSHSLSLFINCR